MCSKIRNAGGGDSGSLQSLFSCGLWIVWKREIVIFFPLFFFSSLAYVVWWIHTKYWGHAVHSSVSTVAHLGNMLCPWSVAGPTWRRWAAARPVSAPQGDTVWCLKHIPPPALGAPWPFPQRRPRATARSSPAAVTRPSLRLHFVSRRAKTSESGSAAGGEAPRRPGRWWATHGRGDALGCPSQGKGPSPGTFCAVPGAGHSRKAGRGGPGAEPAGHDGRTQGGERRWRWQQFPVPGESGWRPCSFSTCPSCRGWPAPSTWTRTTWSAGAGRRAASSASPWPCTGSCSRRRNGCKCTAPRPAPSRAARRDPPTFRRRETSPGGGPGSAALAGCPAGGGSGAGPPGALGGMGQHLPRGAAEPGQRRAAGTCGRARGRSRGPGTCGEPGLERRSERQPPLGALPAAALSCAGRLQPAAAAICAAGACRASRVWAPWAYPASVTQGLLFKTEPCPRVQMRGDTKKLGKTSQG